MEQQEGSKRCSKCKEQKVRAEFHNRKSSKDGLYSQCKKCVSDYTLTYNENNREAVRLRSKQYRDKNPEYFSNYRQIHKEEISAYRRERYAINKESEKSYHHKRYIENHFQELLRRKTYRDNNRLFVRQGQRRWDRNNPERRKVNSHKRRARNRNAVGSYNHEDVKEIYSKQQGLCYYCKEPVLPSGCHHDHMIPLSRGGSNYPDNIAISCPTCNLRKGNKTAEEFFEYIK